MTLSAATRPAATITSELFPTLDEAIDFIRLGALGFSPSAAQGCMDSVRLHSANWAAKPMTISKMQSSLFDDTTLFPQGRCTLDSALLMTHVAARWTADPRAVGSDLTAARTYR